MTRTDLQLKFNKETGFHVLQTGIEMNMYFTDDYIAWLENLVLDKANGFEQSTSNCNKPHVSGSATINTLIPLLISYFYPTNPTSNSDEMFKKRMQIIEILNDFKAD